MNSDLEHRMFLSELQAYMQILGERGISPPLNWEDAQKLEVPDLRRIVREVRDIARTPVTR